MTTGEKSAPPALLMGLANLPFGLYGGLALMTVPQLLAARSVPQPIIASITAAAMIPTFCGFLLSPILDVHFSRRTYALLFGILAAVMAFVALTRHDLPSLTAALVTGFLCANLNYGALGGWLGAIVDKGDEGKLGAGFTIGNISGFGLGAIVFITLFRALPHPYGAVAVSVTIAAPLLMLAWIPPGVRGRGSAHEKFATLGRDLVALVKRPAILRVLLFFCLPASSFALTNTLGGVGGEFGASESFVAIMAAVGVTSAGVIGSLVVPGLIRQVPPRYLYLAIGTLGALFTLTLLGLPRTPAIFGVALIGQNIFQSAAFATEATIIFRSIGDSNPLAATQFAFLQAATALPITYMLMIDGQGYRVGGLAGTFITDSVLSLLACAILLPLVIIWHRRERAPLLPIVAVEQPA
jgi:PAT family beta-lactamase induction signal transducer AmpG